MRVRSLIWTLLVAFAAFSLGRTLVTRDGVGPLEYLVGALALAVLAFAALRGARRVAGHA